MSNAPKVNPLKYRYLIDQQKLDYQCPDVDSESRDTDAYRWVSGNVSDQDNYLPTLLWHQKKGLQMPPPRSRDYHCKKCSLSMYDKAESAATIFNAFSSGLKKKLGYTHIAYGSLSSTDGIASEVGTNGHFSFFQFSACNLASKFQILSAL